MGTGMLSEEYYKFQYYSANKKYSSISGQMLHHCTDNISTDSYFTMLATTLYQFTPSILDLHKK